MKSPLPILRPLRAAFTLVELLVVIAIIAILMGMLIATFGPTQDTVRRNQAQAQARAIVSACNHYLTDYGKYPAIVGAQDTATNPTYYAYGDAVKTSAKCKAGNSDLFDVLRSNNTGVNADYALNKRRVVYIEQTVARDAKNPRGGFTDGTQFGSGIPQGALMDPWGVQYCIVLDAAGNDRLDLSPFFSDLAGPTSAIRATAVAFSTAKDGAIGGPGYSGKFRPGNAGLRPDDLVSWE